MNYSGQGGGDDDLDIVGQRSVGRPVKSATSGRGQLRHGLDTGVGLLLGPRFEYADTSRSARHPGCAAV